MTPLGLFSPERGETPTEDDQTMRENEIAHWRSVEADYAPLMALTEHDIDTTKKKDLLPVVEALGFDFAKQYRLPTLRSWLKRLRASHEKARLEWQSILADEECSP